MVIQLNEILTSEDMVVTAAYDLDQRIREAHAQGTEVYERELPTLLREAVKLVRDLAEIVSKRGGVA